MTLLTVLDILLVIVGGAGMVYQGLCIVMSLFAKPVRFPDAPMTNRYAVLISARNEESVIGNLIDSIQAQTYPTGLIDIWLVADNCTDNTAQVARDAGAIVYERFNQNKKGKATPWITSSAPWPTRQGHLRRYMIFDADNLVDPNFHRRDEQGL